MPLLLGNSKNILEEFDGSSTKNTDSEFKHFRTQPSTHNLTPWCVSFLLGKMGH